jgi:hypothetical protein
MNSQSFFFPFQFFNVILLRQFDQLAVQHYVGTIPSHSNMLTSLFPCLMGLYHVQ